MSMQTIYLRKKKKKKNSYNQNPTSLKTPSSCILLLIPSTGLPQIEAGTCSPQARQWATTQT